MNKAAFADVKTNAAGALKLTDQKSKFKIEHADGSVSEYAIDSTAAGTAGKLASDKDAEELIRQELAAGSKITMTADANGTACEVEIVDALVTTGVSREISSYDAKFSSNTGAAATTNDKMNVDQLAVATGIKKGNNVVANAGDLREGDSVTIGGVTTKLTTKTPKSASDISSVIEKLDDGATVKISRDNGTGTKQAQTYTIGKKTDAVNNVYTIADLADMIKHGDDVEITVADTDYDALNEAAKKGITLGQPNGGGAATAAVAYTVIGNVKSENSDVISKADALQKIADELQKASSIGTDTAATVVNNNDGTFEINKGSVEVKDKLNFSLHVGADADMTNKITVNLESMSAAGLGIKGINVNDETGMSATYAVDSIEDAIKKVSSQRSALGAVQNRLEHTIKNLDNVVENTTAAESQIRDTDMATEMVKYSNSNILAQAGQSMLAQANQSNQGVLSLLG